MDSKQPKSIDSNSIVATVSYSAQSDLTTAAETSIKQQLIALTGEIQRIQQAISKAESNIEKAESDKDIVNRDYWRGEKAQLRDNEKLLRTKENILLEQQKLLTEQSIHSEIRATVDELSGCIKRIKFQPPVEIKSFNSSRFFYAHVYRNLADILMQTCQQLDIDMDQLQHPRYYWLPKLPTLAERLAVRKTIETEQQWTEFIDQWIETNNMSSLILYFVAGELSPSIIERPPVISPPRLPLDSDEKKSEPASDHGLTGRDGTVCVICKHEDHVENAHIVDKSRSELLIDAPNAPEIDDIRNLFRLCPNHHTSFDLFEWTLVQHGDENSNIFMVRPTPVRPELSKDIIMHLQKYITFKDPAPPGYLFLLKQLARFKVPCRVCKALYLPTSLPGHYNSHKGKKATKKWKGKPHLLPVPCDCSEADRGTTHWQLYCHIVEKHATLLYQ